MSNGRTTEWELGTTHEYAQETATLSFKKTSTYLQGDHSGCPLGVIDTKTKILRFSVRKLGFDVNQT